MISSQRASTREQAGRALAIVVGGLMLLWPAFLNKLPFLFPDDFDYLNVGRIVLRVLSGRHVAFSARSEYYSVITLLVRLNRFVWPVVFLQALITAWILWLVVRSVTRLKVVFVYLGVVSTLTVLTSVAWYVSFLTPDILGPVLYLCIYLLVFATETLRRWELICVVAIGWWSTTAHPTHILLGAGLCLLLALLWLCRSQVMRQRGRPLLLALGTLVLALVSLMAIHLRLYGHATLFSPGRPPFLMSRMIADGPGALYLEHHCATLTWVICADVNHLPTSDEDFLWTPGGIWDMAAPAQQEQLRKEETPLAIATLRTYPLQESEIATRNFLHQLVFFGPEDFHNYTIFNKSALDAMAPGLWSEYQRARQDHNAMPQAFFEILQIPVIALSVAAIVFLLPWFWKRRQAAVSMRLLGLAVIVIPVVIANAFLTGALSGVYTRYQGRVIWITGLLALLMLQTWWYERHTNTR